MPGCCRSRKRQPPTKPTEKTPTEEKSTHGPEVAGQEVTGQEVTGQKKLSRQKTQKKISENQPDVEVVVIPPGSASSILLPETLEDAGDRSPSLTSQELGYLYDGTSMFAPPDREGTDTSLPTRKPFGSESMMSRSSTHRTKTGYCEALTGFSSMRKDSFVEEQEVAVAIAVQRLEGHDDPAKKKPKEEADDALTQAQTAALENIRSRVEAKKIKRLEQLGYTVEEIQALSHRSNGTEVDGPSEMHQKEAHVHKGHAGTHSSQTHHTRQSTSDEVEIKSMAPHIDESAIAQLQECQDQIDEALATNAALWSELEFRLRIRSAEEWRDDYVECFLSGVEALRFPQTGQKNGKNGNKIDSTLKSTVLKALDEHLDQLTAVQEANSALRTQIVSVAPAVLRQDLGH